MTTTTRRRRLICESCGRPAHVTLGGLPPAIDDEPEAADLPSTFDLCLRCVPHEHHADVVALPGQTARQVALRLAVIAQVDQLPGTARQVPGTGTPS